MTRAAVRTRPLAPLLLAGLLVGAGPAPGWAADGDRIGLSLDARQWAGDLGAPLFDPALRWVPGQVETRSFWVRNQGDDTAAMTVRIARPARDTLLPTGDVEVAARAGGAWEQVASTGAHVLVDDVTLDPGSVRRVDVRVSIDATSPNPSQSRRLDLDLEVRLDQDTRGGAGGPGGDGDGPGLDGLPGTGGSALWIPVVGLLTAGTGLAVLVRRGREERGA